jgi:lipopolysaccharide transport system permease protein
MMNSMAQTLLNLNLQVFRYRSLIWALSKRELAVRYKGSWLGFLWTFVNPVIQLCVYSLVFGSLFKNRMEDYTSYLFSGIILWNFITGSVSDGASAMSANASLITKSALPPEIIPARVVLTHFLNYSLMLPIAFLFDFLSRGSINWMGAQLFLVLPFILFFCFSLALGFSVLGAMFRDVQYLIQSILFALFFTVPVMYQFESLPLELQSYLKYSPFSLVLKMNADILYTRKLLDVGDFFYLIGISVVVFVLSLLILRRYRSRIAERI